MTTTLLDETHTLLLDKRLDKIASELDFETLFEAYARGATKKSARGADLEAWDAATVLLVPFFLEKKREDVRFPSVYAASNNLCKLFRLSGWEDGPKAISCLFDLYEEVFEGREDKKSKHDFYREHLLVKWREADVVADKDRIREALDLGPPHTISVFRDVVSKALIAEDADPYEVDERVSRRYVKECKDPALKLVMSCVLKEEVTEEDVEELRGILAKKQRIE